MTAFVQGCIGAVVVVGAFVAGMATGYRDGYGMGEFNSKIHSPAKESEQMECIHWLEQQKFGPGNASFQMFADLCGKPVMAK
jgi:hypothetical protein